jgi:3-hydroxymyristoyl/3-hydroxydecanoyl-(acyl carrier protein) dehydratase
MDPIAAIPHRPPVLCIDRLIEADREHAVSRGIAREGEPWLIEGLAQTAALLNAQVYGVTGLGMLVQVRRFEVARVPREGEPLDFRIEMVRRLPPLTLMTGRVQDADGELVAAGEFKFYLEGSED